jgi:hypothetical protein
VLLYTTKLVRIRDTVIRRRIDLKDIKKVLITLLSLIVAGLVIISYAT